LAISASALALTVMSFGLLVTGASDLTWGREIAITQFYPPQMYLYLFIVSLPGQILFGVTSMTVAAVTTTYLFGLVYFGLTGTYFFIDSYVPIAVFLGMHLLFTDPSTSPRAELGRLIFGNAVGSLAICVPQCFSPRTDAARSSPAATLRSTARLCDIRKASDFRLRASDFRGQAAGTS
jgi:hypothetical protein